ncbi:MAG TPA: hypothetical protein VNM47_08030 [Terriglobia bacterium]|nr:hypothetical protein [Terriglobia bacterium]
MNTRLRIIGSRLLAMALVGSLGVLAAIAPSEAQSATPTDQAPAATSTPKAAQSPAQDKNAPKSPEVRHVPRLNSRSARLYYGLVWGVDSLRAKYAESGEIIRFSYRVIDPEKAKTLNEKKNEPYLVDPQAGVKLVVPSLEKVGKLRQAMDPKAGKMYWMAFSNKGRLVRPGHRVNVEIGNFKAMGLIVE